MHVLRGYAFVCVYALHAVWFAHRCARYATFTLVGSPLVYVAAVAGLHVYAHTLRFGYTVPAFWFCTDSPHYHAYTAFAATRTRLHSWIRFPHTLPHCTFTTRLRFAGLLPHVYLDTVRLLPTRVLPPRVLPPPVACLPHYTHTPVTYHGLHTHTFRFTRAPLLPHLHTYLRLPSVWFCHGFCGCYTAFCLLPPGYRITLPTLCSSHIAGSALYGYHTGCSAVWLVGCYPRLLWFCYTAFGWFTTFAVAFTRTHGYPLVAPRTFCVWLLLVRYRLRILRTYPPRSTVTALHVPARCPFCRTTHAAFTPVRLLHHVLTAGYRLHIPRHTHGCYARSYPFGYAGCHVAFTGSVIYGCYLPHTAGLFTPVTLHVARLLRTRAGLHSSLILPVRTVIRLPHCLPFCVLVAVYWLPYTAFGYAYRAPVYLFTRFAVRTFCAVCRLPHGLRTHSSPFTWLVATVHLHGYYTQLPTPFLHTPLPVITVGYYGCSWFTTRTFLPHHLVRYGWFCPHRTHLVAWFPLPVTHTVPGYRTHTVTGSYRFQFCGSATFTRFTPTCRIGYGLRLHIPQLPHCVGLRLVPTHTPHTTHTCYTFVTHILRGWFTGCRLRGYTRSRLRGYWLRGCLRFGYIGYVGYGSFTHTLPRLRLHGYRFGWLFTYVALRLRFVRLRFCHRTFTFTRLQFYTAPVLAAHFATRLVYGYGYGWITFAVCRLLIYHGCGLPVVGSARSRLRLHTLRLGSALRSHTGLRALYGLRYGWTLPHGLPQLRLWITLRFATLVLTGYGSSSAVTHGCHGWLRYTHVPGYVGSVTVTRLYVYRVYTRGCWLPARWFARCPPHWLRLPHVCRVPHTHAFTHRFVLRSTVYPVTVLRTVAIHTVAFTFTFRSVRVGWFHTRGYSTFCGLRLRIRLVAARTHGCAAHHTHAHGCYRWLVATVTVYGSWFCGWFVTVAGCTVVTYAFVGYTLVTFGYTHTFGYVYGYRLRLRCYARTHTYVLTRYAVAVLLGYTTVAFAHAVTHTVGSGLPHCPVTAVRVLTFVAVAVYAFHILRLRFRTHCTVGLQFTRLLDYTFTRLPRTFGSTVAVTVRYGYGYFAVATVGYTVYVWFTAFYPFVHVHHLVTLHVVTTVHVYRTRLFTFDFIYAVLVTTHGSRTFYYRTLRCHAVGWFTVLRCTRFTPHLYCRTRLPHVACTVTRLHTPRLRFTFTTPAVWLPLRLHTAYTVAAFTGYAFFWVLPVGLRLPVTVLRCGYTTHVPVTHTTVTTHTRFWLPVTWLPCRVYTRYAPFTHHGYYSSCHTFAIHTLDLPGYIYPLHGCRRFAVATRSLHAFSFAPPAARLLHYGSRSLTTTPATTTAPLPLRTHAHAPRALRVAARAHAFTAYPVPVIYPTVSRTTGCHAGSRTPFRFNAPAAFTGCAAHTRDTVDLRLRTALVWFTRVRFATVTVLVAPPHGL